MQVSEWIERPGLRLALFWRPGCPGCKIVGPRAKAAVDKLRAANKQIHFGVANSMEERDLVRKYDIRSVPALVLFNDGKMTAKVVGAPDIDQIVQWVEKGTPPPETKQEPCEFCMAVRSYLPRFVQRWLERFDARN